MKGDPLLTKSDIEAIIPHAGGMCLLEQVLSYSAEEIVCRTRSHLDANNPLKNDGKLSKMHLIEYGAQAVAVHGGLLEQSLEAGAPRLGYIATVKSVEWGVFEPLTDFLEVTATVVIANEMSKLYEFCATDAELKKVCTARVMVIHPDSD
jgi:predicted hotdog family 3-hydroxylacyl-ACP dehydratase